MQKYADYTPDAHANIAFVPATHKGKKKLVKPLEVFSNSDWRLLGFPVLDPTLRQDAVNKLRIKEHPPTDQLVRLLEVSPPTTESQAGEWFGVLSRRILGLCNARSGGCVLIPTRLPSFRVGQIICDAYCSHSRQFSKVHQPSAVTAKPMLLQQRVQRPVPFQTVCLRRFWYFSKQLSEGMRDERGTVSGGDCSYSLEGSTAVLPACGGAGQVRPSNTIFQMILTVLFTAILWSCVTLP